jgi:hypothetical protein
MSESMSDDDLEIVVWFCVDRDDARVVGIVAAEHEGTDAVAVRRGALGDERGIVPGRTGLLDEKRRKAGWRAREPASPRLTRHAGLRHDGCHPPSGEPAGAKKWIAASQKSPDLLRWLLQEFRRIVLRTAQRRIETAYVITWSLWRRARQAAAQRSHMKQKLQL